LAAVLAVAMVRINGNVTAERVAEVLPIWNRVNMVTD
jgi:hypothetical protein